eukprot:6182894-Pleurochrysis_carterae.AAC.2
MRGASTACLPRLVNRLVVFFWVYTGGPLERNARSMHAREKETENLALSSWLALTPCDVSMSSM